MESGDKVSLPARTAGQALCVPAQGRPMVGTDRGLFLYREGALHTMETRSSSPNVPDSLPVHCKIHGLAADVQGGFWVGTAGGLMYHTGNAWLNITGSDGLPFRDVQWSLFRLVRLFGTDRRRDRKA